jgi:SHAQKYF class myb-like DNA-binding protein
MAYDMDHSLGLLQDLDSLPAYAQPAFYPVDETKDETKDGTEDETKDETKEDVSLKLLHLSDCLSDHEEENNMSNSSMLNPINVACDQNVASDAASQATLHTEHVVPMHMGNQMQLTVDHTEPTTINEGDLPAIATSCQSPAKRSKTNSRPDAWTESAHRQFVETIYDVGVKNASPAVILENMTEHHQAVTNERVKSHLQKYRNNRNKSKQEFVDEYNSWMQKALTVGAAGSSELASPSAIVHMMGTGKLQGGDLAAFLSYSAMFDENCELHGQSDIPQIRSSEFTNYMRGAQVPFPVLTEEERKSPLGISISHVVSLFNSMTQCIMQERQTRDSENPQEGEDSIGDRSLVEEAGDGEKKQAARRKGDDNVSYEDPTCGDVPQGVSQQNTYNFAPSMQGERPRHDSFRVDSSFVHNSETYASLPAATSRQKKDSNRPPYEDEPLLLPK